MKIICPHCNKEFDYKDKQDKPFKIKGSAIEFNANCLEVYTVAKLPLVKIPNALPLNNPFKGTNVCFTGFAESDKLRIKELAKDLGMNVKSSISGILQLLVCGPSPGSSKIQQARDRNIKIISYDDFLKELKNGNGGAL
ncbi:MAG: hypothetical protein A2X49_02115 [Lentisphaerae bacterium GWF2_52_8]|nr:MAG: hypothetical protein A2X49_02115 [Lentisphaerae bacterium GWF2_52_8]